MRWIATAIIAIALLGSAAACGRGGSEQAKPPSSGSAATGTQAEVAPKPVQAGGSLLNAAELELITQKYTSLQPGETKELAVSFDGESLGSLIVITNKPEAVSASFSGLPFETGDLFGVPTFFLALRNPANGVVVLANNGDERAAVSIDVRAKTARMIEVEIAPRVVAPEQPVTITAKVTQPEDEDLVRLRIVSDRRVVAELRPNRIAQGEWRTTYATARPGFYAVSGRVDGGPTRFGANTLGFEVADGGTRIVSFTDRLVDADHDGLAEALAVTFELVVARPGDYMLTVGLGDKDGKPLPSGAGSDPYRHLRAGRHSVELRWSAQSIQTVGVPGPWHLVSVQLVRVKPDYRTQVDIADLGSTRRYSLDDFEPTTFE